MSARFSILLRFYGIVLDLLALNAVFLVSRYQMQHNNDEGNLDYTYFWMLLNASWLLTAWLRSLYDEKNLASFETFSQQTAQTYFYSLVVILAFLFFTHQMRISRLFVTVVLVSFGMMLLFNRFLFIMARTYMREKELLVRKVVIVGYNDTAKRLTSYLEEENNLTQIIGYCENNSNIRELTNYPVLAPQEKTLEVSIANGVNEIYSTIAPEHNSAIYKLMKEAEKACIRFRFIPDLKYFVNCSYQVDYIKDFPVLSFRKEPLEDSANQHKKRLLDIVVSLGVIVFILSWLVPLLGLLIWLESPGPIFFRQQRSGRNNIPFNCLKFRSMKINRESNLKQATKNDARITRVGRFIRKTSLDEFPQFLNVLRGDMSLVGPRPHMLKHTDEFSKRLDDYMIRQLIKPGITGWAQVNGYRGETTTLEQIKGRVEHDIWYLENWSLYTDIKIMFLTLYGIFRGDKNAC